MKRYRRECWFGPIPSNLDEQQKEKRQDEEKKRKKEEVEEMKQDEVGLSMYISSPLLHPLHVHFLSLSLPKDILLFTDCIISFLLLFTPSNRRQHNNQPLLFSCLRLVLVGDRCFGRKKSVKNKFCSPACESFGNISHSLSFSNLLLSLPFLLFSFILSASILIVSKIYFPTKFNFLHLIISKVIRLELTSLSRPFLQIIIISRWIK